MALPVSIIADPEEERLWLIMDNVFLKRMNEIIL